MSHRPPAPARPGPPPRVAAPARTPEEIQCQIADALDRIDALLTTLAVQGATGGEAAASAAAGGLPRGLQGSPTFPALRGVTFTRPFPYSVFFTASVLLPTSGATSQVLSADARRLAFSISMPAAAAGHWYVANQNFTPGQQPGPALNPAATFSLTGMVGDVWAATDGSLSAANSTAFIVVTLNR